MHRKFLVVLGAATLIGIALWGIRVVFTEFANSKLGTAVTAAMLGLVITTVWVMIIHSLSRIVSASSPDYKSTLTLSLIVDEIVGVVISVLVVALFGWQWWIAGLVGGSATIAITLLGLTGPQMSSKS